jgi:hypothetical protein
MSLFAGTEGGCRRAHRGINFRQLLEVVNKMNSLLEIRSTR